MSVLLVSFRGEGDEEDVINAERRIGCSLPEDYRQWLITHRETYFYLSIDLPELNDDTGPYSIFLDRMITAKNLTTQRGGQDMRISQCLLCIAEGDDGDVGMKITEPDFGAIYASSYVYYDLHLGTWEDDPNFEYSYHDEKSGIYATLWASVRIADNFTDWITNHGTRTIEEGDIHKGRYENW